MPLNTLYVQEAKFLISQRSVNPRDIFKQKEQSMESTNDRSHAVSRPGKQHNKQSKQHVVQWMVHAFMFSPLGKLQSSFLSQQSFEREIPVKPQSPASFPAANPFFTRQSPVLPASQSAVSPVKSDSPGLYQTPSAFAVPSETRGSLLTSRLHKSSSF